MLGTPKLQEIWNPAPHKIPKSRWWVVSSVKKKWEIAPVSSRRTVEHTDSPFVCSFVRFWSPLSEVADFTLSCVRALVHFWLLFSATAGLDWLCGGQRENKLLPALPGAQRVWGLGRPPLQASLLGCTALPRVHTQASGHSRWDASTSPREASPHRGSNSPWGQQFPVDGAPLLGRGGEQFGGACGIQGD